MKKFFILCMSLFLVSGCSMKAEYNMEVKKDKSMDFSIVSALDDELIEAMLSMENMNEEATDEEKTYTDEEKWKMLEDSDKDEDDEKSPEEYGFSKERYEQDEFKGFKYTKKINNIDDISGTSANFNLEDFKKISESIVFEKTNNKYKANFKMSSDEDTGGYDIGIDIKFSITLPDEPISHNATSVSEDGKTLTWNLLDKGSKNVEFEFEIKTFSILPYIGIGAIVLFVIVLLILIIKHNKNKNTKHEGFKSNDSMEENIGKQQTNEGLTIEPTPINNLENVQTPIVDHTNQPINETSIQDSITEINPNDNNINS